MPDRIVLIDGHALVYRAYHALPPLTSPKGEVVNAVYGFISMLLKACSELKPKYLVAAFDVSSQTFRRDEYEAYKATRPPAPDGISSQFNYVVRVLEAMKVPIFRRGGYEADDVLGTLSRQASRMGLDVIILSGDTDVLQLVDPNVRVMTSRRGFSDTVLYDVDAVRERYGLEPPQLADFRALRGDSSDNIPGVPGIGDKTAAKLLTSYGTIENLFQHLDELPARKKAQLEPYAQQVVLTKRLATIVCDLDETLDLSAAELRDYDAARLLDLLHQLGFRTLVDRLPAVLAGASAPADVSRPADGQLALFSEAPASDASARESGTTSSKVVRSADETRQVAEELRDAGGFALVVWGSVPQPMRADPVGIGTATDPGMTAYVPLGHGTEAAETTEQRLDAFRPLLADAALPKYTHDAKRQMVLLARQGVELTGLAFDTQLAAYLLGIAQKEPELREIAWAKLQVELPSLASLVGSGKSAVSVAEVPVEAAASLATLEAELIRRLVPMLEKELKDCGQERLFRDVELPLVPVLAAMEQVGVAVDVPYLRTLSRELHERLLELETEIYRVVGHEFNVNAPKQLAGVLYDELRLPRSKRTASGQGSTGAEILEGMRDAHPVVGLILEHRQLHKLKTTYVDALPLLVHPTTGRIHTSFNQTIAATGRLSSSEPNLQNIPIRTELGRRVRRAFIPGSPGCVLLSADYSQIELRILAHETQDPRLLEAFHEGQDIHAATAAEVMGVEPERVTPDMRRFAKIVNFGVLYGMSEFGLASRSDLPAAEAGKFIQRYFERFGTVKQYQDRIIRQATTSGFAETLLGRRRYFPELSSSIYNVRQGAIRAAINHPIQGAAADIIKIAMIRTHEYLRDRQLQTSMILQVHDELVFEAPKDEVDDFKDELRQIMMSAMQLSVPLDVELKAGPSWDEMAPLDHA